MSSGVENLDPIVLDWAWKHHKSTLYWPWSRLTKREDVRLHINWSRVKTIPREPNYGEPESEEMSEVVYENEYDVTEHGHDQSSLFACEEETNSCATVELTKGFRRDTSVGFEMTLPPQEDVPAFKKAQTTFGARMTIGSREENRLEKKRKWTVHTTVNATKHCVTVANLIVTSKKMTYKFQMEVVMKGTVVVVIMDSKTSKVLKTVENDIFQILSDYRGEDTCYSLFSRLKGVDLTVQGKAKWCVEGNLVMKYAISSRVRTRIVKDDNSKTKDDKDDKSKTKDDEDIQEYSDLKLESI